jgi:hypothetical protein
MTPASVEHVQHYRPTLRKVSLFALYLVVAAQALLVFLVRPGIEGHMSIVFQDVVYGKAHKPYQYRTLLPTTVRIIAEATPQAVKDAINNGFEEMKRMRLLRWNLDYLYEYLVAVLIMFACFVGFGFALRHLVRTVYDYPPFIADLAPVLGIVVLPVFYRYFSYLYDPATLLLFALAAIAVYKRHLIFFYIVFILATVNKETSVLLLGWFLVREYRERRLAGLLFHLGFLSVIWVVIKTILTRIYQDNPGNFYEWHLLDHNVRLPMDEPVKFVYFIVVVSVTIILLRDGWRDKPRFLRHALLGTIIPLGVGGLFFGYVDELRGYYEAVPFIFLLVIPTVVRLFEPNLRAQDGVP